ncbi:uncharacterized protein MCYG_01006 [Microsporum canis CBS 113480]|uniref:Uncharacterized protein n=1 Tax=Arthroderma otae (strain ATCC MYA-4605 / CBS 113480) TaxID=554155 RepID=C5FE84_ARTOC|nr:uncharacterized protein MCYG_01006 [Microsporum canis CBS 113480]EEQ28118.1 predicted protein [Microsporum canis CBS 113480]
MPGEGREESSRKGLVESGLCGLPGLSSEAGVEGEAALLRKGLFDPSVMPGEACRSGEERSPSAFNSEKMKQRAISRGVCVLLSYLAQRLEQATLQEEAKADDGPGGESHGEVGRGESESSVV